jgi:acetyl/propionyl-CoA carboxylase alpha subunit
VKGSQSHHDGQTVGPAARALGEPPLIVLEAMKMQHAVLAPGDGVVAEVRVKEGEQVAGGQVLAVLEAAVTETSDAS